jgi:phospholipase C
VIFTITFNNYSSQACETVRVQPHDQQAWVLDACAHSDGWYDITITVSSDPGWSQRLTGHLETGRASVSG